MKIYTYLGNEYPARKKNFKDYRIKAITFMRKYDEFEASNFPTIAKNQAEIQAELLTNNQLAKKEVQIDSEKLNKTVAEIITKKPYLAIKTKKIADEQALCKELFLFSDSIGNSNDENVKLLCDIMLENAQDIKHDNEEMDYEAYLRFVNELWADFFLSNRIH